MKSQQVGVRELRQNLSLYLRRVTDGGEHFEVTDHNVPVAVLSPLPGRHSALERLIGEGRVIPARLDLVELGLPQERSAGMSISEALADQRAEG